MPIHFYSEEVDLPVLDKSNIKKWISKVASYHTKEIGNISCIFVSDSYILKVNQKYLQHDYYTDVITFDYSEKNSISGDVFISIDTVKTNSKKYNQDFDKELNRVIIHGILHLIGYKDKSEAEAKIMRQKEEEALSLLG